MIHELLYFVAWCPRTLCGIYAEVDKVTSDRAKVECRDCKREAAK